MDNNCYEQHTCFYVCGHVEVATAHSRECRLNRSVNGCRALRENEPEVRYKRDQCPWCRGESNTFDFHLRRSDTGYNALPRALVLIRQKAWLEEERRQSMAAMREEMEQVAERAAELAVREVINSLLLDRYAYEGATLHHCESCGAFPSRGSTTYEINSNIQNYNSDVNSSGKEAARNAILTILNGGRSPVANGNPSTPCNTPNTSEDYNIDVLQDWGNRPDSRPQSRGWEIDPTIWGFAKDQGSSAKEASKPINGSPTRQSRFFPQTPARQPSGSSDLGDSSKSRHSPNLTEPMSIAGNSSVYTSEPEDEGFDEQDDIPPVALEAIYDGFNGCFPTNLNRSRIPDSPHIEYTNMGTRFQTEATPMVGLCVRFTNSGRHGSPPRSVPLKPKQMPIQQENETTHNTRSPPVVLEPVYHPDGSVDLGLRVKTGLHHFGDDENQDLMVL